MHSFSSQTSVSGDRSKPFDLEKIRSDFPLIKNNYSNLSYLDNAASSQKPNIVIDRINDYYTNEHANIHRGLYTLSEKATHNFENARLSVAKFIGVNDSKQLLITKGCTEAINLVASTWGMDNVTKDSQIILSIAEHHANIVPWQMLAKKVGCSIKFLNLTKYGTIDLDQLEQYLDYPTSLVSLFHVSNVLGSQNDINKISKIVRSKSNAAIMIDGAQSTPHFNLQLDDLDIDFFAFSGHKMCGPTGIGILYVKKSILEKMPPYHGGGDMIDAVTTDGFTITEVPHRFEAGTPPIAGLLGLEQACIYLDSFSRDLALYHDVKLGLSLVNKLKQFDHIKTWVPYGDFCEIFNKDGFCSWVGVVSFYHSKIHAHDLACFCDNENVAVRAGHHCAMPLHQFLDTPATLRASPYLYNNQKDIDNLVTALEKAEQTFLG